MRVGERVKGGRAVMGAGAGAAATTTAVPPTTCPPAFPFFSLSEYELLLQ